MIYHHFGSKEGLYVRVLEAVLKRIRGLNVTFRFKQTVLLLLDMLSVRARALGAVNTRLFENGLTTGHNIHAPDKAAPSIPPCRMPNADLQSLTLLGAGGAGAAVAHAVLTLGAQHLFVCDLEHDRAKALASGLCKRHGAPCASVEADISAAVRQSTGNMPATATGID